MEGSLDVASADELEAQCSLHKPPPSPVPAPAKLLSQPHLTPTPSQLVAPIDTESRTMFSVCCVCNAAVWGVCSDMQSCCVGCVKRCEVLSCGLYAVVCSVAMWVEGRLDTA